MVTVTLKPMGKRATQSCTLVFAAHLIAVFANLVYTTESCADDSDERARDLGRKVIAIQNAIADPASGGALEAVTELGQDSRYYVMVRGWLSLQLEGDLSIANAQGQSVSSKIEERIAFLKRAIRAIDLE